MRSPFRQRLRVLILSACTVLLAGGIGAAGQAQQVVQRGAFGVPSAVLDQSGQWSELLPLFSNADVNIYMEDVSSPTWLAHNADSFLDRGQYTLTVVSFYKTRHECREDQINAGYSDAAHMDACDRYRYRVRQVAVDSNQKTITLLSSEMLDADGNVDPGSVTHDTHTRPESALDAQSREAIAKAEGIISRVATDYNRRQKGIR